MGGMVEGGTEQARTCVRVLLLRAAHVCVPSYVCTCMSVSECVCVCVCVCVCEQSKWWACGVLVLMN